MRLEVGRIDKAHGVTGDVLVTLTSDRTERLDPGAWFEHDDGRYTVVESRPHQHRFIVNFRELTNREQAQAARGTVLYGEPIHDPDVLWVHELIGADVVDTAGSELGTVEAVEDNPASDLLVLAGGGLIPLTFFVERHDDGTIVVDPPIGLLDVADAVEAIEAVDAGTRGAGHRGGSNPDDGDSGGSNPGAGIRGDGG